MSHAHGRFQSSGAWARPAQDPDVKSVINAGPFILDFFQLLVRDAYGGDDEARAFIYQGRTLEHALDCFHYDNGIAWKFRLCYTRWSKALRRRAGLVGGKPIIPHTWRGRMSLKQEVNRVLEIVEQIETLTPSSYRYLMALIGEGHDTPTHSTPAQSARRGGRRGKIGRAGAIPALETDESPIRKKLPPYATKSCCGSHGPRHLKTCTTRHASTTSNL